MNIYASFAEKWLFSIVIDRRYLPLCYLDRGLKSTIVDPTFFKLRVIWNYVCSSFKVE